MITPLSPSDERELIAKTKAGDNEAAEKLLNQYRPAFEGAAYRYSPYLDQSEIDSATHAGFMEAVHKFDYTKHDSLANVIKYALNDELMFEKASAEVTRIPDRTIQRYYQILRKYDGDANKALRDWNKQHHMLKETFLNVHHTLKNSGFIEDNLIECLSIPTPETESPEVPEAVKSQVTSVFEAHGDEQDLTPEEVQVLTVHFGLAGYSPSTAKGFNETADELGMSTTDTKTHYKNAISKARKRLTYNN
ncbi:RNA polymerase sigma factor [Glutamicibacter sp. TV12E]|uniref:RNA polymerase sigma factor n=1 Tax=Glutamicibacter sp. TV12E TaxID=3446362 RepID=UPI004034D5A3